MSRAGVREVADLYFERFRAEMDGRLETFEARFETRLDKGLTEVRSEFKTQMAEQRADLVKWMFIFWIGTIVPLAGLIVALTKL